MYVYFLFLNIININNICFVSETQDLIVNLLKRIQQDFSTEFNSVISTLPQEVTTGLQTMFQA